MYGDNQSPKLPLGRADRWLIAGLALVLGGLGIADLLSSGNPRVAGAVWVFAWWGPLLLVHELGHALVALLLKVRVEEVGLGLGREWLRFGVGPARVRVRTFPVEGYVLLDSSKSVSSAKQAAIYLAGPAAELLSIALIWPWTGGSAAFGNAADGGALAAQGWVVCAGLGAFFTLLPHAAGGHPSDGLGAYLSLFESRERAARRRAWLAVSRVKAQLLSEQLEKAAHTLAELDSELSEHPLVVGATAACRAAEGQPDLAFELLEKVSPPEQYTSEVQAWLLQAAAWSVVLSGQSEELVDAQGAAERAAELCEHDAFSLLLLGMVAYERGRYREAARWLSDAYYKARSRDEEQRCLGYLSLCLHQLGDAQAPRFAHALLKHNTMPKLSARVRQTLALSDGPAASSQ